MVTFFIWTKKKKEDLKTVFRKNKNPSDRHHIHLCGGADWRGLKSVDYLRRWAQTRGAFRGSRSSASVQRFLDLKLLLQQQEPRIPAGGRLKRWSDSVWIRCWRLFDSAWMCPALGVRTGRWKHTPGWLQRQTGALQERDGRVSNPPEKVRFYLLYSVCTDFYRIYSMKNRLKIFQ